MKKKRHIFLLFFLAYFFIYAVSPLSYAYELDKNADHSSIQSPKIFIVELLLSKLIKQKSQDTATPSGQCLLKKKRATLSSNKIKVSKDTLKKICIVPDNFISIFADEPSVTVEASNERKFHKSFRIIHSGLSPPLA